MKMARDAKDRMYSRDQGGVTRWYIDLRHLGGCREGLIPEGEKKATSDWTQAVVLAAERLKEVAEADEKGQRAKVLLGTRREPAEGLRAFAAKHLVKKAKGGKVTTRWLEQTERQLEAAVEFFGEHRTLASIEVADVESYVEYLDARSNGRGGTLGLGSQRHYLNSLSNLYKRAQGRVVASGYNPVAGVMEKPVGDPDEAAWLEVSDSALLLESARTYRPDPDAHAAPVYPLIATFLLSGGRTSEVLGLELDDVSFQRQRITFRPNEWRRLKSKNSRRSVPLWPQLEEILRAYFADKERDGGLGRLVFPSLLDGEEKPIKDFRKALDAVAGRCGWQKGEIRSKMFRHTYCSARLQTLDGGAPVSPFTVSKELGHGGLSMMEQVYGHLGQVRHRSEVVEYRLAQHREALGDRIETLETLGV